MSQVVPVVDVIFLKIRKQESQGCSLEPFFQESKEEETSYAYFMQDSTSAHTAENIMQALWFAFDECIISRECDLFFQGL
jgi:hypothetical protein